MIDEAEVHPDGPWPVAREATVMFGGETYKKIPIVRIDMTPATLMVRRESYRDGAVILNEILPPENMEPIVLPITISTEDIPVDVQDDGGWPSGVITIFSKQNTG